MQAGYIQCEKIEGEEDVIGLRILVAPPSEQCSARESFDAMHASFVPKAPATVPDNLKTLAKTHEALAQDISLSA